MKFKNNLSHDVYVDLGGFVRVAPGEVIDLEGTSSCPPLTPVLAKPKATPVIKKKATKKGS